MLFFLIHCALTPIFSDTNLRFKACLKMVACIIGVFILYQMDTTLFDPPSSQEPEPVKIVTKGLICALVLDFFLFGMYLALGFGGQNGSKDKNV